MMPDSTKTGALKRLQKDVEQYHAEIERYTADIKTADDEYVARHLRRLLEESQRALTDVLMRIESINKGAAQF
ncbi:hypothetical protein PAPHI01_0520 [Pancytospora philotis]|nr:hypothetical protein PAPHI01_0520 [Pancytospora philotis]